MNNFKYIGLLLFLTLFAAMTMNVSAPGNDKRPVITISSPQNSLYNKTNIPLNVSANEPISIWLYSLNGGTNSTFTQYTATTANAIINASQGANSIIVYAKDKQRQGYWNSSRVDFSVDSVPPVITIISPQNITYNTTSIPLNVSANEAISNWKYSLNGGTNSTFTQYTATTANAIINASQGANNITVYALDGAGNWNSRRIDFSIDSVPPVIMISSPQNSLYNKTNISLNVSANEAISVWEYSLNGGANVTFTPNASINASQGANSIIVYASDIAGNWNLSAIDFQVDTIPPSSIIDLINISYANDYINWTWTDPANDDFSYIMIYLNGEFKTDVPSGVKFYSATGLIPDTEYTIGTRTVDTSGNINQTWVNHTARTLPPPPPTLCDSSCGWTVNYIVY
jgi:hypothetical protein